MKQREYYFDNAKFILIFLVVFGHLLRSFIEDSQIIYTFYKVIYTFHMPAFVLISGFFAKGYRKKGYVKKLIKRFILPYLIFQTIYSIFYYFIDQQHEFTIDPLTPHWSLWFLISLFFWNIMLYLFARFNSFYSISIALVLALAIGFVDSISSLLSLSRTFVFFPLFLLGYYLKKEHFYRLLTVKNKTIAMGIFLVVLIGFYLYPNLNYEWLLGSKSYSEMGDNSFQAMFTRLGLYGLCMVMVISFFTLVPNKSYSFTNIGEKSLYIYLLHGFFIRLFRESEVKQYFSNAEGYLLLAGISFLLTLLLSSKTVTSFAQPLIELKISNLKQIIVIMTGRLRFYWKRLVNN